METITVTISQSDVYNEVAKATDYTGSKLIDGDENARNRILAVDEDFKELGRFWDESVTAVNEDLKEMLVSGITDADKNYKAELQVSKSWDKTLQESVQSSLRSFFIDSIIGQWFKFANKGEAKEYFATAGETMLNVERLLYARKRPTLPTD